MFIFKEDALDEHNVHLGINYAMNTFSRGVVGSLSSGSSDNSIEAINDSSKFSDVIDT